MTKRGRAVLLDLGLATFVDDLTPGHGQHSERLVGTLNYMAPEVVEGSHVTRESDWYSFGAILWELALGDPPDAPSAGNSEHATDLSKWGNALESIRRSLDASDAPIYLKELCLDLLHPDPNQRPKAPAILERLRETTQDNRFVLPFAGMLPFVGRTHEMKLLTELSERKPGDRGGRLILVNGERGLGRTRLVEEWLRNRSVGTTDLTLRATCNFKDSAPYRLINSLVQSFVGQWKSKGRKKLSLNDCRQKIAVCFPQFFQILDVPDDRSNSEISTTISDQEVSKAARLFTEKLARLSFELPLVIVVDNAQWSDDASTQAMLCLWQGAVPFQGTIIAIYDSTETTESPPSPIKSQFRQTVSRTPSPPRIDLVTLPPMTTQESVQLATHILTRPGMPIQPTSRLAVGFSDIAKGNPQLLDEVIRSFREADSSGESWLVRIEEMRGQDVEQFRFRRLKKESRQIVEYLSVARVPVSFQQLQIATRVGPELLFPYLGDLAAQNWIEWHGVWPDLRLGIHDPSLQDRVRKWTDRECIQRRHARLAQSLVLEVEKQWPEIAHHYAEAGKIRRAIDAYLEAASQASIQGNKTQARQFLEQARSFESLNREQIAFAKKIADAL